MYAAISKSQTEIDGKLHTLGESVKADEFMHVVLVIIAAVLNPCMFKANFHDFLDAEELLVHTEWDIERYADRVKLSKVHPDGHVGDNDVKLSNYFEEAGLGDIDIPATILDHHHRIIPWHLPSIICQHRIVCTSKKNLEDTENNSSWFQDDYNNAVLGLDKLLEKSMRKHSSSTSWRGKGFTLSRPEALFHPGTVDLSPGWFMQRQQVYGSLDCLTELNNDNII